MAKDRIFLNVNDWNDEVLNLHTGNDIKEYIEIITKVRATKISRVLLTCLQRKYGLEERYFTRRIKEECAKQNLKAKEWSERYIPQYIKVRKDEFTMLSPKDQLKLIKFFKKFGCPTWGHNAIEYLEKGGLMNLSWSTELAQALYELKSTYYESST